MLVFCVFMCVSGTKNKLSGIFGKAPSHPGHSILMSHLSLLTLLKFLYSNSITLDVRALNVNFGGWANSVSNNKC